MYSDNLLLKVGLANIKGIGSVTFKQIIDLGGELSDVIQELVNRGKVKPRISELLLSGKQVLDLHLSKGINITALGEADYPTQLSSVYDPPKLLFYKGDLTRLSDPQSCISIVGTRKASTQATHLVNRVSQTLGDLGYRVISGLAFGVDVAAHKSAVNTRGGTVAVVPGSVEVSIPASNSGTYNQILSKGGLVVSEMPVSTVVTPGLFPKRNRIIAGLSIATVVIEASIKSGALITARQAFGYGREVFAFPAEYGITSKSGTNLLIKSNIATLVDSVDDLVQNLGINLRKLVNLDHLSSIQKRIYDLLSLHPYTIEQLCDKLHLQSGQVLRELGGLELDGIIFRDDLLRYRII